MTFKNKEHEALYRLANSRLIDVLDIAVHKTRSIYDAMGSMGPSDFLSEFAPEELPGIIKFLNYIKTDQDFTRGKEHKQ